jgi:HSP20 family protein
MTETTNKVTVKADKTPASPQARRPFEGLRREIGSLYEDFFGGRPPSRRSLLNIGRSRRGKVALGAIPAVDVTETDKAYQITSELPVGMGEKNVEVRFAEGVLTIKGEKQEEREEKKKSYSMRESSFGSFERTFQVPDDVDTDKIKASFKMGCLRCSTHDSPPASDLI